MNIDAVTPLRQRMVEDMNARKLCAQTQRGHIHSCKRFAEFLPWRFLDAGRKSAWIASSCRHPKTCTIPHNSGLMHRSKHDGYSITSSACPRRHSEQLFGDGLRVQNARKKR
jgi:hypothetical protein